MYEFSEDVSKSAFFNEFTKSVFSTYHVIEARSYIP
jgi:hypothetical protein